jgi:hypothetical protein
MDLTNFELICVETFLANIEKENKKEVSVFEIRDYFNEYILENPEKYKIVKAITILCRLKGIEITY